MVGRLGLGQGLVPSLGLVLGLGSGVSVRVNYFRDSFSILLRAQHYSMF